MNSSDSKGIAIIGMSGRFPGAPDVDAFWRNIAEGVESISTFSDEELAASGIDVAAVRKDQKYVPSRGVLPNADHFDASFFGMNANEAAVTDPQQRLFLEASWEVLEKAGYDPEAVEGLIGVYAGMGALSYFLNHLHGRRDIVELVGERLISLGNDKDYLATRVAYKLNLRGPALNINTACSTSLVAVCQASQDLLHYQCDLALAGGVSLTFPQKGGVHYYEGGVFSPDGRCRPFDEKAQGTVSSDGLGVVLLKRVAEAIEDGDTIYAVIKGIGLNNDGSGKVGFTAPSVDGQAEAIVTAQAQAGFEPDTISYVEAHGTATPLGDPIEISALTQAFRLGTEKSNFCAIGSIKSNIGHLNSAAGIAGLIKTALSLKNRKLPPSLNFTAPNPKIDFADSPFFVNTKLVDWKSDAPLRRAGVSSFGLGGTNAHVVLEEAPAPKASGPSRADQLLVFSAKSAAALDGATANFLAFLKSNSDVNLADAAYTLQVGRRAFAHRRIVVCRDVPDAIQALETLDSKRVFTQKVDAKDAPIAFMFPGQGAQYVNMGADLYRSEPVFKTEIDRCAEILLPELGLDLRKVLYPATDKVKEAEDLLVQTRITQPAMFAMEYALAKLWMSWGVNPQAMIGHSLGEYTAACVAEVFSLEDALRIVAARAKLVQAQPGGAMLAVRMPGKELAPLVPENLSIAAVNSPAMTVVSGPCDAIDQFGALLKDKGIASRRLETSHAFHSAMLDPVLEPLTALLENVKFNAPTMPYISNVTAEWVTPADATSPAYWAKHMRHAVRFADGAEELLKSPETALLEVGPGRTLATFATQIAGKSASRTILPSLPPTDGSELSAMLTTLGRLWLAGKSIDWTGFYANEKRRRIPLPTYAFQRERFWIERTAIASSAPAASAAHRNADPADWFYVPSWKRSELVSAASAGSLRGEAREWLIFVDEAGLGEKLAKEFASCGDGVTQVTIGQGFKRVAEGVYSIHPEHPGDYGSLISEVCALGKRPQKIVHLWSVSNTPAKSSDRPRFERSQDLGLHSLLSLVRALGETNISDNLELEVVSNHVHAVTGEEALEPAKATVLGAVKVIPLEYSNIRCRSTDVVLSERGSKGEGILLQQLLGEFAVKSPEPIVAYRGGYRWVETFEPARLQAPEKISSRLKQKGVYLITGGLGGVGLALAEFLSGKVQAKLVLTGRSTLPSRNQWVEFLATHDDANETVQRIKTIQRMESAGSEVLILTADVADRERMREAISTAKTRFGRIDGVIHAAGCADSAGVIERRTREATEEILAAKVKGTVVLDELLPAGELDFLVLCSTLGDVISSVRFGQVGYAAANEFLDAFAMYKKAGGEGHTVTVNWDYWREVGMSARAVREQANAQKTARLLTSENSLSTPEGANAFHRIVDSNCARVVVSVADLDARRKALSKTQGSNAVEAEANKTQAPAHARPDVSAAFAAPATDAERALAAIWQEVFGIQQVGVDDNFFDLGGDSLLAVQLIAKVNKSQNFNLSIPVFFQNPTVKKMAALIEKENHAQPEARSTPKKVSDPQLIAFQEKGTRPPLFFLHGDWAGGGLYCGRLSQRLGDSQPFYALPPYRSGKQRVLSLDEMVAHHLAVIRSHSPHGPYLLGGYCVGAKVALEIARELVGQGESVPHLFLLDLPQRFVPWLAEMWPYVDRLGDRLNWNLLKKIHFFDRYPIAITRWYRLSRENKLQTLRGRLRMTDSANASPVAMGFEVSEYNAEVLQSLDYAVYFLASCLHDVKPISIPTSLYFSEESLPQDFRQRRSRETFREFTVDMVPGNHHTCITKYAYVVADKMEKTLSALEPALPPPATKDLVAAT